MGLHASQLAFDDDEPLVDELGRVHGHLVLVIHRLLVVDGNQGVDDILRPLRRPVPHGKGQDGRIVLLLAYAYAPGNGSIPGYNSCFIANYKTNETVMMFSNNIDYWDLKEDSDYILHHYVGYRPEFRF